MVVYPWYLFNHYDSAYYARLNKLEAEESNRRFFKKVREEIPKKIEETGLFNMVDLGSFTGFAALLSLKKYPNVWGTVVIEPDSGMKPIQFQCYINEHKWSTMIISEIQFYELIKFDLSNEKNRWFTEKDFLHLIEMDINNGEYYLSPGKFRYEDDNYSADWDDNEVVKYLKYKESVIYYTDVIKDGMSFKHELKHVIIKPDFMQRKLMYIMSHK